MRLQKNDFDPNLIVFSNLPLNWRLGEQLVRPLEEKATKDLKWNDCWFYLAWVLCTNDEVWWWRHDALQRISWSSHLFWFVDSVKCKGDLSSSFSKESYKLYLIKPVVLKFSFLNGILLYFTSFYEMMGGFLHSMQNHQNSQCIVLPAPEFLHWYLLPYLLWY